MDNCYSSTKQLLKLHKIKHTNTYIKDSVLSHPDHPSLLSIADTLTKYDIENVAIRISEVKFDELPTPCIIQVSVLGTTLFYTLNKITKLSLKNLKLGADDMLQRSQLKTVFGGYGGGSCQSWVNGTH